MLTVDEEHNTHKILCCLWKIEVCLVYDSNTRMWTDIQRPNSNSLDGKVGFEIRDSHIVNHGCGCNGQAFMVVESIMFEGDTIDYTMAYTVVGYDFKEIQWTFRHFIPDSSCPFQNESFF